MNYINWLENKKTKAEWVQILICLIIYASMDDHERFMKCGMWVQVGDYYFISDFGLFDLAVERANKLLFNECLSKCTIGSYQWKHIKYYSPIFLRLAWHYF